MIDTSGGARFDNITLVMLDIKEEDRSGIDGDGIKSIDPGSVYISKSLESGLDLSVGDTLYMTVASENFSEAIVEYVGLSTNKTYSNVSVVAQVPLKIQGFHDNFVGRLP